MPEFNPRNWKEGDLFSASHLQESVDILRAAFPFSGRNSQVTVGVNGTSMLVDKQRRMPGSVRIPVFLEQVGGADGTPTTYPTWTYKSTNALTGRVLSETMTYGGNRSKSPTKPATRGDVITRNGEWVLWGCDEAIITDPACAGG